MGKRNQKENFSNFYYKTDRLNQLRGFCAVVQNDCSAPKASEKIHLEPGSITRQIKALEEQLGITLFDRTGNHRLILNENGRKFYPKALEVLNSTNSLYSEFAKELEEDRNRIIRIAGHSSFFSSIFPKYLKKLLSNEKFKDLKVNILNIHKNDAIKRLMNNEIDIAFYPSKITEEPIDGITKENIFRYKNIMLMSKDANFSKTEAEHIDDFKDLPYFFLDKYDFYNPADTLQLKPSQITFENATWEIISALVRENLGVVILPDGYHIKTKESNKIFKFIKIDDILTTTYFSSFIKKKSYIKESLRFLSDEMKKDKDI